MSPLFQAGDLVKLKSNYFLVLTVMGLANREDIEPSYVSDYSQQWDFVYNLLDMKTLKLHEFDVKEEDLEKLTEKEEQMVKLLYGKKSKK